MATQKDRPVHMAQVVAPPYDYAEVVSLATDYEPTEYIVEVRTSGEGNLKVDMADATGVVIPVGAFDILRIRITKIYKTGTTATGITVFGFLA